MTLDREREILPLTGLRAVAAWWVVLFHFARGEIHVPVVHRIIASGHVAVDLFFVLSGFVLARRYQPEELATWPGRRDFWRRRFARVYPVYVLSLALGFYSEWPQSWTALGTLKGALRLPAQLALLNAFSHFWMFRLNWAAWSLSVEAFFYLIFPWLLPWVLRQNPWKLLAACTLAAYVAPALYTAIDPDHLGRFLAPGDEILWSWYLKFFPLQRLPMFIGGIAGAQLLRRVPPRATRRVALALLLAVVSTKVIPYPFLQGGALLPVFVALVVGLGSNDGEAPRVSWGLGCPWLVRLGHASYATYILHVPLFVTIARFDEPIWSHLSHVAVYCVVLLVVSLLTYRFIEEPLRRRLSRPSRARASPAVGVAAAQAG